MDREAILRRKELLLAQERGKECRWFWLSFADEKGWKGGCFVLAPGFLSAVDRAVDLGINPGGEVLGSVLQNAPPPVEFQNRLLTKADLEAAGGWEKMR